MINRYIYEGYKFDYRNFIDYLWHYDNTPEDMVFRYFFIIMWIKIINILYKKETIKGSFRVEEKKLTCSWKVRKRREKWRVEGACIWFCKIKYIILRVDEWKKQKSM